MTVRIAKNLGVDKILNLSRELEIYDEIPELLSVSLGSVETSLLNLTSVMQLLLMEVKNKTCINQSYSR